MNYSHDVANLPSFKDFLFKNRRNRIILIVAGLAAIIQFSVFKYYFPFASFIHNESFSFIDAAASNADINTYPIGYSKFLRLFNTVTKSDTALVAFQYISLQTSTLFLLFSLFYFYKISKATQYILCGFMILNPLFLYLANLISPDAIFASISLTWFTLLLWIIHRPHKRVIAWQAITIAIAFTISYKVLLYPFISGLAFWSSPLTLGSKIRGWGWGALLCFSFFSYTGYKYQLLTGRWQFAPYLGWLTANNALIAYREVDPKNYKPISNKFKGFDTLTRLYFKEPRNYMITPAWEKAGIFYMINTKTPLVKYKDSVYSKIVNDTTATASFTNWAKLGIWYRKYAWYILRQYPREYATYFIWTNIRRYFSPPADYLNNFNNGNTFVSPAAHTWFAYKRNTITPRFEMEKDKALIFYPFLTAIFHLLLVLGVVYYLLLRGKQYDAIFNTSIFLAGATWFLNTILTVCICTPSLRNETFIIMLTIIFTGLLIDWMRWLVSVTKSIAAEKKDIVQRSTISAISHS